MSSISEYAKAPVLSTVLFSYSSHVSLTDEDFMLAWESPFAGWRRERRFMSKKSCEAAESTEGSFCEWRGVNSNFIYAGNEPKPGLPDHELTYA